MIFWAAVELGRPYDLVHKVWDAALFAAINPVLVVALVEEESRFKPTAFSWHPDRKGSDYGLFQLNSDYHPQHRKNIDDHVLYGTILLKDLLHKYPIQKALSHYNTGRDCKIGRRYAARVLHRYTALLTAIRTNHSKDPKSISLDGHPPLESSGGDRDSVTPSGSDYGHLAGHLAGEGTR